VPGGESDEDYGGAVPVTRYRCTACGNLTRFDVTTTRTTRAFNHFTVGGDLEIEEVEVLDESIDEVSCRWCGHGRGVEVLGAVGDGDQREPALNVSEDASSSEQPSSVL